MSNKTSDEGSHPLGDLEVLQSLNQLRRLDKGEYAVVEKRLLSNITVERGEVRNKVANLKEQQRNQKGLGVLNFDKVGKAGVPSDNLGDGIVPAEGGGLPLDLSRALVVMALQSLWRERNCALRTAENVAELRRECAPDSSLFGVDEVNHALRACGADPISY